MMPRLTETCRFDVPPDTFQRCQLCGYDSDDICEFRMWAEAEEDDKVTSESPVLITCKTEGCQKIIDDHERLYVLLPWSRGGAGRFMLLCGDCPHREAMRCTHPNLSANGGGGLLVNFTPTLGGATRICFSDGSAMGSEAFTPATACEGHPAKKPAKR